MFGERKFSVDLEMQLDESQNNIENIESILEKIKDIQDETEIKNCTEYYFRMIENHETINNDQIIQILNALKEQKNIIINDSPKEDLSNKIVRMKKDNENMKYFSIVETKKEDNDKIDGFRHGVLYLEFDNNGYKEFYEIENIDLVSKVLSDFDLLKDKNCYEIMSILRNYCRECTVVNMENKNNELPTTNYDNEMKKIYDDSLKEVMDNNENTILKERVDFQTFVNQTKKGMPISYMLNSNGERIYIVGEEKFKFVGEERTLSKLSQDGKNQDDVNISRFNSQFAGSNNLPEIELENFRRLDNYIGYENLILYIMRAMDYNIGISHKQNDFLVNFVEQCMVYKELDYVIPGESLNSLYEKFMIRFGLSKLEVMKNKLGNSNKLENPHVLKLTNKRNLKLPKDNKLSNWEKAGFISVAIILETSLILAGVFSILALVKK